MDARVKPAHDAQYVAAIEFRETLPRCNPGTEDGVGSAIVSHGPSLGRGG
jgi:hypothetical protein